MYDDPQYFLLRCGNDLMYLGYTSDGSLFGPVQMVVSCDVDLIVYYENWAFIFDFRDQRNDLELEEYDQLVFQWHDDFAAAGLTDVYIRPLGRRKSFFVQ